MNNNDNQESKCHGAFMGSLQEQLRGVSGSINKIRALCDEVSRGLRISTKAIDDLKKVEYSDILSEDEAFRKYIKRGVESD